MRRKWIVAIAAMGLVLVSEAAAVTWSAPVDLSAAGQNADQPQVTVSADGTRAVSVWRRYDGSNYIIQGSMSVDSGATWSTPPDNLSAAGQNAGTPQVAVSADGGNLTSVWSRYDGSHDIIQAFNSAPFNWIDLSAAGQNADQPQVTVSADGTRAVSVWTRWNGSHYIIQARTSINSGATWSAPVDLSAAGQSASYPQVAGSADGSKLTSVWRRSDGDNWIIQASTSSNSGATWSAPVDLSAAGQSAFYPQVTGSADGTRLTSVWVRYDGSNDIIQAATGKIAPTPAGMFYVIPNREGGGAVIYLE